MNEPRTLQFVLEPSDSRRLARLCGQFDQHLHLIEERLGVSIRNRGNHFVVEGAEAARYFGSFDNALLSFGNSRACGS